eukprot:1079573-Pelagomonas_calceolata.AAC.18
MLLGVGEASAPVHPKLASSRRALDKALVRCLTCLVIHAEQGVGDIIQKNRGPWVSLTAGTTTQLEFYTGAFLQCAEEADNAATKHERCTKQRQCMEVTMSVAMIACKCCALH